MKIFSNKFSLHLQVQPSNPHFGFDCVDLDQVEAQLLKKGPDFSGQVVMVKGESRAEFLQRIFALHTRSGMSEWEMELALCFDSEAAQNQFAEAYEKLFKLKPAAGGAVLNEEGHLLMIHRNELWDLPKGKIEKGENRAEAAVREVEEECGISGPVILSEMETSWHIFPLGGKWVLKPTYWYLMRYTGSEKLVPQTEEGITQVEWQDPARLVMDMPDTYPIIQTLIREVREMSFSL